eukprot:364522-Chlamydomonas_euryale.AAC.5
MVLQRIHELRPATLSATGARDAELAIQSPFPALPTCTTTTNAETPKQPAPLRQALATRCWRTDPLQRPSFLEILQLLSSRISKDGWSAPWRTRRRCNTDNEASGGAEPPHSAVCGAGAGGNRVPLLYNWETPDRPAVAIGSRNVGRCTRDGRCPRAGGARGLENGVATLPNVRNGFYSVAGG